MTNNDSAEEQPVLNGNYRNGNGLEDNKITDKYHFAFILLYILGTLTQVPANFFVTANDYWMYKFRDVNTPNDYHSQANGNRTALQKNFTSNYSIVSNVSTVLTIIVIIKFLKRLSMQLRFMCSLPVMTSIFILTLIFIPVNTDSWQNGFYGLTLAAGGILTAATGIFMLTVFQLASKFPPKYMAAVLSGQAICGIAAALAQIFSLGIGASSQVTAAIYFSIATLFVFASTICLYLAYKRSEFFRYNFTKTSENMTEQAKITKEIMLNVLKKIKWYLLVMVTAAGSSVLIFPGLTSLVVSIHKGNGNKWNDVFYIPVCTFLLYHSLDLVGRESAAYFRKPNKGTILMALGVFRIVFIPLIMFCNAQPRKHTEVLFFNDYDYIIFMIVFAFTNGYLINMAILQIPVAVNKNDTKIAIVLIVLVMILGLGICSAMNPLLVQAL